MRIVRADSNRADTPVRRLLIRVAKIAGAIVAVDTVGLWAFLLFQGRARLLEFANLLTILLLLEGALLGAAGCFLFFGYSEYAVKGQAALWPSLAGDQLRGWRERRLAQQKWGFAMVIIGVLLILLGLLVSLVTTL